MTPTRKSPEGAYNILRSNFRKDDGDLFIEWYSVTGPNRGMGISKELVAKAINEAGPGKVKSISGEL